jgi:hypothetical protein
MFKQYDCFRLKLLIKNAPIPIGTHGVVLEVHKGEPSFYEVEFPDGHGSNLNETTTFTITDDFMESLEKEG